MTYLIKFNKEELGLGAAFGAAFWPALGWKAAILAVACSILWAIGGSGYGRIWRYLGAPLAAFLALVLCGFAAKPVLFALAPCVLVLTFGYGIPDPPSRPDADEGSMLGRLFYNTFNLTEFWANIATRATYAGLLCLGPCIALPGLRPEFLLLIPASIAAVVLLEGEITI